MRRQVALAEVLAERWAWFDEDFYEDEGRMGGTLHPVRPDGESDDERRIIETDSGCYGPYGVDRELIAAAPDMARALLALQWIEHDEAFFFCPSCNRNRPASAPTDGSGHAEDCVLIAALRRAGVVITP